MGKLKLACRDGIFLCALLAAPQAWGEVCQREFDVVKAAYAAQGTTNLQPHVATDMSALNACTPRGIEGSREAISRIRSNLPRMEGERNAASGTARLYRDTELKLGLLNLCRAQNYVNRCSGATSVRPATVAPAAPSRPAVQASPAQQPSAPRPAPAIAEVPLPENALGIKPQEAAERAANRQRAVDAKRKFHPRRHVPAAEASKCLTLQTGPGYGGFVNSCNYAVEFVFCNVQPKKDSWGEAFDCDKGQQGAWQVGPLRKVGMHTKGAGRVNWFACRWGETLGKPDGVSPADVEYRAQERQLFGRCAQWGAG
ncbi:MAG: hypothetical protein AB7O31_02480 [Burkholderiales bacterium]